MLEKLSLLERMEKMMQRWENSKGVTTLEEKGDKGINLRDLNLGVVATPIKESSKGTKRNIR